jgi:thiamine biosynthesis lipoprotein
VAHNGTVAAVQCVDRDAAPRARDTAQAVFDELNAELSAWSDDSALARVNRAAGAPEPVPVPPAFATVLRFALSVADESGGAFNPLIGPIMRAWGFNGADARPAPPAAAELRAAAALADWRTVQFVSRADGSTLRLPVAGMRLDLGAVAKGYAVDLAWECLRAAGHTNLLVDLGGNLRALGEAAPGRGGWRTGVRNPFEAGTLIASFPDARRRGGRHLRQL